MRRRIYGRLAGIGLLTAGLLAGLLTGCGSVGGEGQEEARGAAVSLDWYVNFSWYSTTWGGNLVSDAITDKTGVTINYIAPKGSEKEKLKAMMASDTLPDLLTMGWWEEEYQELVEQDKVYDLKELAGQYCPEFLEVVNPVTADWYTDSEGSMYGYPNSSYTPQDMELYDNLYSNQNFLVRKDIYEALGSPDMTTQEGFMDAVRRAVSLYPQVDGQPLIPIGSDEFTETGCNSFENYLLSFLAVPYEKDGVYYDRSTDPDYLSWLKVFRQLGQEGCLKNDIFIDKRTQLEDKIADGRYFCLFYQNMDIAVQQRMLQQDHPERIYVAVDGPKNAAGADPVLPMAGIHGWTVTMIPKTCKDPEQAIQFLTYLISEEGQKMLYLGVEGEMYQMEDGKPQVKPEVTALLNQNRLAYDETYGADDTYWMLQNNAMQLQWEYNTEDPISQMKQYTCPYVAYTGQYDLDFSEDAEKARLYAKMQQLWGSALRDLLLAESDAQFDARLQEYLKARQTEGYDRFVAAATEAYARNKEKLGVTDE